MEDSKLTPEQEQAKNEAMMRAVAFEELVRVKGFEFMKAYYENSLRSFVNELMSKEESPIESFEAKRQQLIGLKKMFGDIDWSLQELENERKNSKPTK